MDALRALLAKEQWAAVPQDGSGANAEAGTAAADAAWGTPPSVAQALRSGPHSAVKVWAARDARSWLECGSPFTGAQCAAARRVTRRSQAGAPHLDSAYPGQMTACMLQTPIRQAQMACWRPHQPRPGSCQAPAPRQAWARPEQRRRHRSGRPPTLRAASPHGCAPTPRCCRCCRRQSARRWAAPKTL